MVKTIQVNEKIKKISKYPLIYALVMNIFYLGMILIFCDLKYEVSDDFIMSSILSGAFGDSLNPKMIFVNVIIGYILLPFYKICPEISWYFILQLLLCFLSFVIITYMLFDELDVLSAILLSSLFLTFFADDAYIVVQFTKTAMLAIMAGALLFLRALFHSKKILEVILGAILCLFGTMFRFQTTYMAGTFILFILCVEFYRLRKEIWNKKGQFKNFCYICLSGFLLISIAFGLNKFDASVYAKDSSYNRYKKYSNARAGIVDYEDYGYEAYKEELDKLGVSENDYYMMRKWNFADNSYFSTKLMSQVADIIYNYQKSKDLNLEEIYESLQDREFLSYPVCLACIIGLIFSIIFCTENCWSAVISFCIGGGLLTYLAYRERMVYRVEYAVFAGIFMCMAYFWKGEAWRLRKNLKNSIKVGVLLLLLLWVRKIPLYIPDNSYKEITTEKHKKYIDTYFYWSWDYNGKRYRKVTNKNVPEDGIIQEIKSHPENFYFLDFNTTIQSLYFNWNPFKALPIGYFDNFAYLGGITTNYPDVRNLLKSRDVGNPLRSLIKDDVYLVDNDTVDMKINYLKEHYCPNAWAELIKEVEGYQIWKIHRK